MESIERRGQLAMLRNETDFGRALRWEIASSCMPPLMCKFCSLVGQALLNMSLPASRADERGKRRVSNLESLAIERRRSDMAIDSETNERSSLRILVHFERAARQLTLKRSVGLKICGQSAEFCYKRLFCVLNPRTPEPSTDN